ncbi:MAG TPA: MiaB/RimO family radical SAM methylthiotransferase [Gemmatimonadaceae bacterium]|nr:MiaB/RimO family radical SAM methylthiotransferase [Gemmatimonadaceae bacterium]
MRVYLETFGCRANHYDSERVQALARSGAHEIVTAVEDADVAVFNSCAVTAEAERDVRKAVRRAARRNPRVRSLVMGCSSALPASQAQLRALPTVERLVSGADLASIAEFLGVRDASAIATQSSVRATLRIQDGCDEHCTFCATTIARGNNRSRGVEELLREAQLLAERHPEIVITGTHIGTYGRDNDSSLGALMQRLVRDVSGVRFRLSSLEATEVDDALFDLLVGSGGRVAPHLHAPLQSGSDRILKRMGRHWYTAEGYAECVERLAARLPVFGLGADIIVAFPGETEDDYLATVALVERLPFTYLHVFTWSPRPGTAATRLPDHVPLGAAQERSHHVRHLGQKKGKEYRAARAGSIADVIAVGSGPDREGMTEDYLTVRLVGDARPRGTRFVAILALENDALVAL